MASFIERLTKHCDLIPSNKAWTIHLETVSGTTLEMAVRRQGDGWISGYIEGDVIAEDGKALKERRFEIVSLGHVVRARIETEGA